MQTIHKLDRQTVNVLVHFRFNEELVDIEHTDQTGNDVPDLPPI